MEEMMRRMSELEDRLEKLEDQIDRLEVIYYEMLKEILQKGEQER